MLFIFFFFNDTATTEIYTLSLHDALPIFLIERSETVFVVRLCIISAPNRPLPQPLPAPGRGARRKHSMGRSEEHTSELQSRQYLVCRLLLEKKKHKINSEQP